MLRLTESNISDIKALHANGMTLKEISRQLGFSYPTVSRYAKMPGKKVKKLVDAAKDAAKPKCSTEGCKRPVYINGLCGPHQPFEQLVPDERPKQVTPALSDRPLADLTKEELEAAQKAYEERMKAKGEEPDPVLPEPAKTEKRQAKPKIIKYLSMFSGGIEAMNYGANKYKEDDWRSAYKTVSEVLDKCARHLMAAAQGKDMDAESGLWHLDHLMADAAIAKILISESLASDDRLG